MATFALIAICLVLGVPISIAWGMRIANDGIGEAIFILLVISAVVFVWFNAVRYVWRTFWKTNRSGPSGQSKTAGLNASEGAAFQQAVPTARGSRVWELLGWMLLAFGGTIALLFVLFVAGLIIPYFLARQAPAVPMQQAVRSSSAYPEGWEKEQKEPVVIFRNPDAPPAKNGSIPNLPQPERIPNAIPEPQATFER